MKISFNGKITISMICLIIIGAGILTFVNKPVVAQTDITNQNIIDAINMDLQEEWSSYIQYMKHGWEAEETSSYPKLKIELFKKTAKEELDHIDMLGERIVALGGIPSKKPSPVVEGGDIKKMAQDDLAKENSMINQYKAHIQLAIDGGDEETQHMLEKILAREEKQGNMWEEKLGIIP